MRYINRLFTYFLLTPRRISLQTPRSTRSSSVVTFSRPPTISSLKITDRSFRDACHHGDASLNERSVIFNEEMVGGREKQMRSVYCKGFEGRYA